MVVNRETFVMRAPCKNCGGTLGVITEKGAQDVVRCAGCATYCYCAPRVETGKAVRSVTTVHNGIKPKDRARILERDGYRCVLCGARPEKALLHAGHILSVDAGLNFGLTEIELNDDENLIAMCAECNLGQGAKPLSLGLAIAILRARISWRDREDRSKT